MAFVDWAFPFSSLCDDLTAEEREIFARVMRPSAPGADLYAYENYLYRLYWLTRVVRAKKIVELGVFWGQSSAALMLAAEKNDGHLWSCDLADMPDSLIQDILPVYGTRRTVVPRERAQDFGARWDGGPVDLIYEDTSHEYGDTREIIDAWMPHLRDGGFFVFHDTSSDRETVFRAIADSIVAHRGHVFEAHQFPDALGHMVVQKFNDGRRFNFGPAEKDQSDSVVGLSTLLASGRRTSQA